MYKDPKSRPAPSAAQPTGSELADLRDAGQDPSDLDQAGSRPDGVSAATSHAVPRPIARLVPHSGIQFIDLTLPVAELAQVQLSFAEHRYASGGRFRTVLMPLERAGSGDIVWHPVSHRALAPDEIMSVSGQTALDTFAGRWVPLPYLRFLGRDAVGLPSFDSGPENWARVFVAPPAEAPDAHGAHADDAAYRIVLAFDTRLEAADRTGDRPYLAPNADDASLGASFKFASGAVDVARFAGRPWIDGWLRQIHQGHRPHAFGAAPPSSFELEHIARFLVFVELLGRSCPMPEIRFVDTLSRRWPVAVTGVDLLLDVTDSDTAAVLVDRDAESGSALIAAARPLTLRDLTNPVTHFAGPIPTQLEFAPQPFGDAGLSRRSGRPDAFLWPSLGRIGQEAAALSLGAAATAGVTGQSALPSMLGETSMADDLWRMGGEGGGSAIGPVVAGPLLAHVAEDGTPLAAHGDDRPPAIRPRFAPSALLTFFMAELLLHAVSAVNAGVATADAARAAVARRLHRIVVTLPAGMSATERDSHVAHVGRAVDLVWRALGWDSARDIGVPQRPEVVAGTGTDLAGQLFELRRELATRYGHDPSLLAGAAAATVGSGGSALPASQRGSHVLRVASIQIDAVGSSAIVTDYAAAGDGALHPLQAVSERWHVGGQGLDAALADEFVLRAIATSLSAHGHPAPDVFLSRVLDTTTTRDSAERNLARRLRSKIIRPAAAALLRIASELPPRVAGGQRVQALRGLVTRGGGRFDPHAAEFDTLAQRDGAAAFKLDRVEIRFNQRQLDQVIRSAANPAISRAAELVVRQGCDLVLVAGDLAALPAVADALVAALPLEPGRIVRAARATTDGGVSGRLPGFSQERAPVAAMLTPGRFAGIAGAYLSGRSAAGFEAFDRVVRSIGTDLSAPMPAPPAASALPAASADPGPRALAASAGAGAVAVAAAELIVGHEK